MAATFVQQAKGVSVFNTTTVASFANVATGSVIVVTLGWDNTSADWITLEKSAGTATISAGTILGSKTSQGSAQSAQSGYLYVTNGGSVTIRAITSAAATILAQLFITEVSGPDPTTPIAQFNATGSSLGSGTNNIVSGNITTTRDGCLIFGATYNTEGGNQTPGTGFTQAQEESGGVSDGEYMAQSSAGTVQATFNGTSSAVQRVTVVVAVQPPASAVIQSVFNGNQFLNLLGVGT